jgi:hypothetical protein
MPLNVLNRDLLKVDTAGRFDPFRQLPIPPPQPGPRKLTMVEKHGSVTFKLDGVPVWSIDVQAFSGNGSLAVTHEALETTIELRSAFFPATQLPADFVCAVRRPGHSGTTLDLVFTLGNFRGMVIAESWLAGLDVMKSAMTLDRPACNLRAFGNLTIKGHAQGTFFPDWRFEIAGTNLATIDGLAPALSSDSFSLKLLKPGDPSLRSHPKSKRSHIGLAGTGKNWQLKPALPELPIGQLHLPRDLFDRIDIEAGEGAAGDISGVLAASSPGSAGLTLRLAGGVTDIAGNPALLPMSHAIYAAAFDTSTYGLKGGDVSLSAGFEGLVSLLSVEGFVLLAGGAGTFRADASNGTVTTVRCEPSLLRVAAPLTGGPHGNVFASPLPVAAGTVLPIVAAPGMTPGWGIATGPDVAGKPRLSLADFSVSVARREDLPAIEFTTFNLALEGGGGESPRLSRKDPHIDAYLMAHFNPPQHIDRLAFRLPAGIDSLPYSIDSLLDWVRLEATRRPVAFTPVVEPTKYAPWRGWVGVNCPPRPVARDQSL